MEEVLKKLIKEISENRARIIDDFGKAYISSRDDYDVRDLLRKGKLELVEEIKSPTKRVYFFRVKRGRNNK